MEVGPFEESAPFTVTADVTSILYLCKIITDSFFKPRGPVLKTGAGGGHCYITSHNQSFFPLDVNAGDRERYKLITTL